MNRLISSIRDKMNSTIERYRARLSDLLIVLCFLIYALIFSGFHEDAGVGIAALAILPVIAASWYRGAIGGIFTALFSIVFNLIVLSSEGLPLSALYTVPGDWIGFSVLVITAFVIGKLSTATRERMEMIRKLEKYESEHRSHADFLELLNTVTAQALEADNLTATLDILTTLIAKLFKADDGYFSTWDDDKQVPIPTTAYGAMSDIYSYLVFEPGEQTLTASLMKSGHPIPIPDIENSEYISQKFSALFPDQSMLGLPLIAQERKLGSLILGYTLPRQFDENEILHATMTAEQVALVLSKSLLLEEERKQVRQLSALHDVALTSIETDHEDQLIERVTEIIGKNLFPDNFGILLLDAATGQLRAHPSYRFYGADDITIGNTSLEAGITGEVARTGRSQRIGNVRLHSQYVDVDDRTISELCVPIKFKEHILGVINAESKKRNAFTGDDERLLVTLAGQLATAIEQMRKADAERKWLDQLAHANGLIYAIAQITTQIEKAMTMEEIIQTLGDELHKINLTCIMAVYDSNRQSFTVNYTSLAPGLLKLIETGLGYPLVHYTFPRNKLQQATSGKDLLHPTALPEPEKEIEVIFSGAERYGALRVLQEIGVTSEIQPIRVPLVYEDNLLGMLWVWGNEVRSSDLPIISIFAKQVAVSFERSRLFQEVQSLALTDPLTELHNRRSLFELGRIEFARARRMKRPFCCLMLDLDHFKQINDDHGHQAGDQVLREFSSRCKRSVREMDIVGRYGGEELMIVMPETDLKTAIPIAERLRKSVADAPIQIPGQSLQVTVSIGVAQSDQYTLNLETLIARADQAMYIAKHRGRNRVATSK
jgi:diguanylate cyclase (GGDEF)-like protein